MQARASKLRSLDRFRLRSSGAALGVGYQGVDKAIEIVLFGFDVGLQVVLPQGGTRDRANRDDAGLGDGPARRAPKKKRTLDPDANAM